MWPSDTEGSRNDPQACGLGAEIFYGIACAGINSTPISATAAANSPTDVVRSTASSALISIDSVICCNSIDHAFAPETTLREIHRVLKPGAVFFFDVHTFSVFGLVGWDLWTRHLHTEQTW
jgi:SAM-dependent methyltransferase